ncbi:MAG: chromosome segregation protein SMC [Nitrosomonas sp.]|nr:MAG: chromosome segregation protein SMC [Nitrosomonas sp.]
MRLTHIKLAGFKSFVDSTVIPVSYDLVGIVGPNGCGKSNIIDAVRWVLGESKASTLRGESMQDVIFSGSDNRKAIGRASVEIVLDNQSGKAPGQWSGYSEIAIKRVLHRDGVSGYYINNLQVRRRDITDLFLGTGSGSRGYAIIEQGVIAQIIEAKPLELRSFLEEAAGISQYRERKSETSMRLTDARKNMMRLEDILQELNAQLSRLASQAAAAQQYLALQEQLQYSQALLWHQRKSEAELKFNKIKQELVELDWAQQAIFTTQRDAEQAYETIRAREYSINERLLQVQGELYRTDAEIGRIEQQIHHMHTAKERLVEQLRQIDEQLLKNVHLKTNHGEQLAGWEQERIKVEQAYQLVRQAQEAFNLKLPVLEAEYHQRQDTLTACRQKLLIAEQNNQLENNHIFHATKNIQQLEQRQQRLFDERRSLAVVDPEQLSELQQEIGRIEAVFEQDIEKKRMIGQQLEKALQFEQEIERKLHQSRLDIAKLEARQAVLQNLQQKLENNQKLSSWLNTRRWDVLPRLWQHIQIASVWETALEAVLRERLNSLELIQLDQILDMLTEVPPGRWAIYAGNVVPQIIFREETESVRHPQAKLLEFLSCYQTHVRLVLEDWLHHVYVAADTRTAFAEKAGLSLGDMLVTPEGHIVTRHSCTFYAPDTQLHGVLSRQQELASIQTEYDRMSVISGNQHEELVRAQSDCDRLKTEVQCITESTGQLQSQLHQLQLDTVKLSQRTERTAHRNRQIDSELNEIQQSAAHESEARRIASESLVKNKAFIDFLKQEEQNARQAWEATNQSLAQQKQENQLLTKQLQETAFHLKTCESKIYEITATMHHLDENSLRLTGSRDDLQVEISMLDDTPIQETLETASAQRATIESTVRQVREELTATTQCLREIEINRLESEHKLRGLQEAISQTRLKAQAIKLNIDQLDEMIATLTADLSQLSPLIGKKSNSVLQSEITELNKAITALGSINLAAIEELENMQARESNLQLQLNDLKGAIATLENVIRQIDDETQKRLLETFSRVNAHLGEIFPVIFSGGQAKLIYQDSENVETGFILTAQPPGKKNGSIHLLSGGEKALTALALVFSLFRLNPAPFCLLDEVDAPLDDSNTVRFCDLVKELAKYTQFLFISHNKITMEMAHRLVGVTMQERGISRVVAVDLADAIKLGKREMQPIV